MRRIACLALLSLAVTLATSADELVLRGGRRVSGIVVEETARTVVVDIGAGRVGFPRAQVQSIVRGSTALAAFRERLARLRPDDVDGLVALGQWAQGHDLATAAREAFEKALLASPGDARAHSGLGHELVAGRWLEGDDIWRSRGYMPFEGRWVTPAEQRALLTEREADLRIAADQRREEARVAEAEARAAAAEARARRVEQQQPSIPAGIIPWAYAGSSPWSYGGSAGRPCWGRECSTVRVPVPTPEPAPTPRPRPVRFRD